MALVGFFMHSHANAFLKPPCANIHQYQFNNPIISYKKYKVANITRHQTNLNNWKIWNLTNDKYCSIPGFTARHFWGSPYNALYIETITESLTVQYSQMYIFCMSEKFVFPFYSLNYMKLWNIYTLFPISNSNGHKPINIPKICLLRD